MNRHILVRFALGVLLLAGSGTSLAQQEIFVTNNNSNAVTVYARTASGDLAPLRTLAGPATGLTNPSGLFVDEVNNELVVVNKGLPYSVTVYPRTANGDVAPLRTIVGAATGLSDPRGVAVDPVNSELSVVNRAGDLVTVYARTANGNAAPLRSIVGLATGLSNPWGIVLDLANNELVVANNGNSLTTYARTANGNAPPVRTIAGATTGFNNGPIGVALDSVNNELIVSNPFLGASFLPSVLAFPRAASGDVAPSRAIAGAATGLSGVNGLAVDAANNEILVPNSANNSVTVYARTASGDIAPLRTLAGLNTQLNNPQFLVITTGAAPPPVPPVLAKAFSPASITAGGVSTLTITLTNPDTTVALLAASLIDTLPGGLSVAATPNVGTTCGGTGAPVAVAGGPTVTLPAGRSIPASGSCTLTVNVTAPAGGSYVNTLAVGALVTTNGNNTAPAVGNLSVVPIVPTPPTLGKAFGPAAINPGGIATLTITLNNPDATVATLTAALIDTLPAGVTNAAAPNAGTTCGGGGAPIADAGGSTVTLPAGRTIPAAGSCTLSVDVTATLVGSYVNTLPSGALTTSNGNNAVAAVGTLTVSSVVPPPPAPSTPIPTLSQWALLLLGTLLVLGAIAARRRQ